MLQRRQSIYLFFAGLVSVLGAWLGDLWKSTLEWIQPEDNVVTLVMFLLSSFLSFFTIFLFKKRKVQMRLGIINILLNILLIGYLIYFLSTLPGGLANSEKGVGLVIPFISIILLFTANRFIKKDEELVKSVDRFR